MPRETRARLSATRFQRITFFLQNSPCLRFICHVKGTSQDAHDVRRRDCACPAGASTGELANELLDADHHNLSSL